MSQTQWSRSLEHLWARSQGTRLANWQGPWKRLLLLLWIPWAARLLYLHFSGVWMAFCVIEAPGQTCKKRFWQGEVSLMVTAFITDAVYSSSNAGMLKLCHQCGSQSDWYVFEQTKCHQSVLMQLTVAFPRSPLTTLVKFSCTKNWINEFFMTISNISLIIRIKQT